MKLFSGSTKGSGLSLPAKLVYASGQMGASLMNMITVSWLLYYYTGRSTPTGERTMLVSYSAFALVNIVTRVVDALSAPVIGYASDRFNTPLGRRKPWIIFGAPLLVLSGIFLFFPPTPTGSSLNVVWLLVTLTGLWVFYTAVVAPYISLLPEISSCTRERVEISSYMGVFEVLGTLSATIAVGLFIKLFPDGVDFSFISIEDGYRVAILVFGSIALILFWLSVSFVKETPRSAAKEVPFTFRESVLYCFRNRPFVIFILTLMMFMISLNVLIIMIPFMVTLVMGFEAHVGGYIQGSLVLASLLMFLPVYRLSTKYGKKKVFGTSFLLFAAALPVIAMMDTWPFIGRLADTALQSLGREPLSVGMIRLVHATVPMVMFVFPLASFFVLIRPIFADLIDLDEKKTGYRREAMYDGLMGLGIKVAAGGAAVLGPLSLKFFGGTVQDPGGIRAVFIFCTFMLVGAFFYFRKYPVET